MDSSDGLVFAYLLDGSGGGRPLDLAGVRAWRPEDGLLWVHLDYSRPTARAWLVDESGIDPVLVSTLAASETRPRCLAHGDGLLVILRGVNLNPGADPEDMVSVRFWVEERRIVTLRRRRIMAVEDLRQRLLEGAGPTGPADFVEGLASRLADRMGEVLGRLDESFGTLEDEVLADEGTDTRGRLADVRRAVISLRRHLAPQREVVARLAVEGVAWLDGAARDRLREVADRTTRYVEELDEVRDRATVAHEELTGRMNERMNRTMYILSIVAGLFLPLGFLTGLLGINVGGLPGMESPWAFWIVCVGLGALTAFQVWFFRRMKWM